MSPLVIDGVSVCSNGRRAARLWINRSRPMRRRSTCGDELMKADTSYRSSASEPEMPAVVKDLTACGSKRVTSFTWRPLTDLAITIRADFREPSSHHSSNDARSIRASWRSSLSALSRRSVSYHAKTCSSEIKLAG